jgi:hypothetical protein
MGLGNLFLDGCIISSDVCILGTFAAVFLQLFTSQSAEGMSLQTLIAVVTSRSLHLLSHWLGIHYRPTQIWSSLYFLFDIVNAAVGIGCISIFMVHKGSYDEEKDNFGIHIFDRFQLIPKSGPLASRPVLAASFVYAVTVILAFFWSFFRTSAGSWYLNYFCCVYEVMCMVALIPQLWMFHKDKWVSQLLGWFVVMVAANRVCTLTFWLSYTWVNPWSSPANRGTQILTELLNLAVLADFLFYWARAKLRGEKRIRVGSFHDEV